MRSVVAGLPGGVGDLPRRPIGLPRRAPEGALSSFGVDTATTLSPWLR